MKATHTFSGQAQSGNFTAIAMYVLGFFSKYLQGARLYKGLHHSIFIPSKSHFKHATGCWAGPSLVT